MGGKFLIFNFQAPIFNEIPSTKFQTKYFLRSLKIGIWNLTCPPVASPTGDGRRVEN